MSAMGRGGAAAWYDGAMSWQLRVGAVQMRSTDDLGKNLEVCRGLTADAAAQGAQLVVLPECFSFLGRREGDKMTIAEAIEPGTGPVMTMLRELATKHGIWIVGGGTPEAVPGDSKRAYNTAVVVDPNGALAARYRKIHLFDIDIPGTTLRESDSTAAGRDLAATDVAGARVGMSICYDVRFPELYRKLVHELGAQVLLVPAAFTAHTGAAHWHVLLRARAIEDQAWVIAAAQWGRHNEKRESFGHTLIIDPWGTIVAERPDGDGVVVATIDGAAVEKRRAQMPCLRHAALLS
jgi:predicted amidohydrolase